MSNCKYLDHDEIVKRMGGSFGRFQIVAYIMCLILFSTEGFLIYNLAFLNLEPKYKCVNTNGLIFKCQRLDTCSPLYSTDFTSDFFKNRNSSSYKSGFYIDDSTQ